MTGNSVSNLVVISPCDGSVIAELATDNGQTLAYKIERARQAQKKWADNPRATREKLLTAFSDAINANKKSLIDLIIYDAGKTEKEASAEVVGAADILKKTIENSALPEFGGMTRCKERPPVGVVGLITSFNFPLAVAHWTIAPALLAGNAVIWKPSEKTPMVAATIKENFDSIAGEYSDLLQIIIGDRDIGARLVAHEQIDMISATGSVAMGQGIKAALAQKENNKIPPILELGGNNGVIISEKITDEHLTFAVSSIMGSFLATSGQRCTNTRRLIVQEKIYDKIVSALKQNIEKFLASGAIVNPLSGASNDYGYAVLIDEDSFQRFESAKKQALLEGGKILFGDRLRISDASNVFFVEPALALMPKQSQIMHKETFAPLLFVTPYKKFSEAIDLVNAPENAGLVNGIYTQSKIEAEIFARENQAGHCVINSPKGTGTPAFGMGFGGNKHSGEGEILNNADPLQAFTRPSKFNRIAINSAVNMDL
ncbi:MAG: aldehyde dehydrogenase family protein [Rickettsiales bacterium]